MPPDPPRTLAPAARAKNAFGILFSPPNCKNAARSLCCVPKIINSVFFKFERSSFPQSHFDRLVSSIFNLNSTSINCAEEKQDDCIIGIHDNVGKINARR